MEDKYKIKACTIRKDWDNFVIKSLNKNIFTMWDYIDLENNLFKYFCLKNDEVVAAFILKKSENGQIMTDLGQIPNFYQFHNYDPIIIPSQL